MSKILYIINILRNFSSKNNPLTIRQITDLSNKYYDPAGGSDFINEVTTRRALTSYLRDSEELNDIHGNSYHANYRIHVLYENPDSTSCDDRFLDVTDEYADYEYGSDTKGTKRKKEPKTYYYYEPFLATEEIANLINMVESHPYYTSDEVLHITNSLQSIAPAYFRNQAFLYSAQDPMRSNDSTLENNLHDLHHIINEKQDVRIEYSYYNEKKELVPHTNYPQRVTPYQILWSNGYCYLAAFNPFHNAITHYRVDRITYIEPIEDDKKQKHAKSENPVRHKIKYSKEHPVMMSGETIRVSMLCERNHSIVNRLLDCFGMDIKIRPVTQELLKQVFPMHPNYKPEQWMQVICDKVNPDGAALWAKQYCTECVIYEPQGLAAQIKKELQAAACRYC